MKVSVQASFLTPVGAGGIGVVVVSGGDAASVIGKIFEGTIPESGELKYGFLIDVDSGERVDEVLCRRGLSTEIGGHSTFEINGHGGLAVRRRTRDLLHRVGVDVVSAPDWFREQARYSGMAPVTVAACLALSRVRTRWAARVLLAQSRGVLAQAIESREEIDSLLGSLIYGRALIHPPQVVLAGGVNVGKSTLVNRLLGRERVLVNALPGTTRDVVRSVATLGPLAFEIVDTAGYREVSNEGVESKGIDRARESIEKADHVLFLSDSTRLASSGERSWLEFVESRGQVPRVLRIASKCDRADSRPEESFLPISTHTGIGLEGVVEWILEPYRSFLEQDPGEPILFESWMVDALKEENYECLLGVTC